MNARGMALVTGLILLAAISLLGLVAASGMLIQRQMASNFSQDASALEQAEIATSYASAWLFSRANHERESACIDHCVLPVAFHGPGEVPALAEYESAAWWRANGIEAGINPITGEPEFSIGGPWPEPPLWILEEMHFQAAEGAQVGEIEGIGYYRILGRGAGSHASSVAITESIFARPWGEHYSLNPYPPGLPDNAYCEPSEPDTSLALDCGRLAWRQRR